MPNRDEQGWFIMESNPGGDDRFRDAIVGPTHGLTDAEVRLRHRAQEVRERDRAYMRTQDHAFERESGVGIPDPLYPACRRCGMSSRAPIHSRGENSATTTGPIRTHTYIGTTGVDECDICGQSYDLGPHPHEGVISIRRNDPTCTTCELRLSAGTRHGMIDGRFYCGVCAEELASTRPPLYPVEIARCRACDVALTIGDTWRIDDYRYCGPCANARARAHRVRSVSVIAPPASAPSVEPIPQGRRIRL